LVTFEMPPMKPLPVSWRSELTGEARIEAWRYAGGKNKDGTDKTANAHGIARDRVWELEIADIADRKPVEERTEEEKRVWFKVKHPREYRSNRKGNICRTPMLPPSANWKPDLFGAARTEMWKKAAGLNDDGTDKTYAAHADARKKILRDDTIRVVESKNPIEWTDEDRVIFNNEQERKAKERARNVAKHQKLQNNKMDIAHAFIEEHGLSVQDGPPMSAEDVSDSAYVFLHDKESVMGKALFEALGGKTPWEALWVADSDFSFYISASRGMGDVGGANAEGIRFLVHNPKSTTVLTNMDGNDFKYADPAFKNLKLLYCPIGIFKSYADCTAVEGFLQLLFDFLPVGSKRLWLESNVGRFARPLRTCDMKYIQKLEKAGKHEEAKNVVFFCGITILKNVSVLSRINDPVSGKDVVGSIQVGNGTFCKVHQPKQLPRCSQDVKDELVKLAQKLGPNFTDRCNRKRKTADIDDQSTSPAKNDGIRVCENDECDSDNDSDNGEGSIFDGSGCA
jgi:hypothetical protein